MPVGNQKSDKNEDWEERQATLRARHATSMKAKWYISIAIDRSDLSRGR
jgi:hypothetical protein